MIYLLNAIVLTPGGSSTVHIYTQTIHISTQNIEQHNKFWNRVGRARSLRVTFPDNLHTFASTAI